MSTTQREEEIEMFTEFLTDIRNTQKRLEQFESGDFLTTRGDLYMDDDFSDVEEFFETWCESHREILGMEIQDTIIGFLTVLKLNSHVTVSVS
jgi:hypothetical protein